MYFEAILKNVSTNKLKNILNIFQLTISLFTIITLLGMIYNIKYKIDSVKEVASLETIKGSVDVQAVNEEKDSENYRFNIIPDYLNKIYKEQQNYNDITIGRYQLASLGQTNMIRIDENFSSIINLKIYDGRSLEIKDFKNLDNSSVPVIVSYDMKDKFPISSEFTVNTYPKPITCHVIGILNSDAKFWINDNILVDKLEKRIIVPTNEFEEQYFYIAKSANKNNIANEKLQLNNKAANFNTKEFKVTNKNNTINNLLDERLRQDVLKLFFLGMFCIVLLILVLIGVRSLFALQVIQRKKEFGIHYSLGGTAKDIFIIVVGEMLFDVLISVVFAMSIFKIVYKYLIITNSIMITNVMYVYSIIIVLLIVLFSIIFTLNKLLKTNAIELIRSNQE
jgi:ABC-type antimicrobial peptide transport system permease subunit